MLEIASKVEKDRFFIVISSKHTNKILQYCPHNILKIKDKNFWLELLSKVYKELNYNKQRNYNLINGSEYQKYFNDLKYALLQNIRTINSRFNKFMNKFLNNLLTPL